MAHRLALAILAATFVLGAVAAATDGHAPSSMPTAVATYECIGLYWRTAPADGCRVEYRRTGEQSWHPAFPLVFDERDGEFRGSIVGLSADTAYEVHLRSGGRELSLSLRTRSDRFPTGVTTTLPGGDTVSEMSVTQSGTPDAYHLVAPPANGRTTIDAMNHFATNLTIDADFVVVRGIELRNAATHGILIKAGHHDIVIEDCHISGWGRFTGPLSLGNAGGDQDSAVYAEKGCGNLTIQRNLIENPRGAANDWESGHPVGPQGVSLINSTGGNVVRYNEIVTTEDHGFNDGFGGGDNFSRAGSPNRDSDIYGNIVRGCWDDAIESEGANMNVRIWGNYLDRFYNGIATACTSRGPLYIFRNVWGESRRTHRDPQGGAAIKTGERDDFGGGRRFVFHNTVLQPRGVQAALTANPNPNCVSRNNLFDVHGGLTTRQEKSTSSDYDYDLYNGNDKGVGRESHGVRAPVAFLTLTGRLEWYPAPRVSIVQYGRYPIAMGGATTRDVTDPIVNTPNPAIDAGEVLPNFNEDYTGKAPDLGAFEIGRPPLEFGRRAYLKSDEGWAPWEMK